MVKLAKGVIFMKELCSKIVRALGERGLTLSTAESCTGGLVAKRITDVSGCSDVFMGSCVTYANEAKMRYLGVSAESIAECGVVSERVASEMSRGVAETNAAQVGVGITGIAGPTGGSEKKPVGTVCFGFFINGEVHTSTVGFGDIGRTAVREASVRYVYETLYALLIQQA